MKTRINDINIAYDDQGEGLPIVFIHGFPLSRQLWKPQIRGLSDVAQVIVPDLRGHGESESTSGVYPMDLLASDVNALLNKLEVQAPIILCGLSMGGYIAFAFYRLYKERLAGLILAATRAGADSEEGKNMRDQTAAKAMEEGVGAVAQGMLPKLMSPVTYERKPELVSFTQDMMNSISVNGMVGDLLGMKERPDSSALLNEIQIPTLILHGVDDTLIPVAEAESMEAALPNGRLRVLPEAGHLLNLEQPILFNQEIGRFLTNF